MSPDRRPEDEPARLEERSDALGEQVDSTPSRALFDDEPDAEALRAQQLRRFERERRQADRAGDEAEVAQHERRAERAGYLADKLAERAASERES